MCAMDCAFVCPFDQSHELTDYHIVNRIRTGLYDETIQEFVTNLRMCAMDCAFVCPFDQSHELTDYIL